MATRSQVWGLLAGLGLAGLGGPGWQYEGAGEWTVASRHSSGFGAFIALLI